MNPLSFIIRSISKPLRQLEYNPVVQFKFNFFFVCFWLCTMVIACFLTPKHTDTEWIAFLVLEVSLWANFISHLGALSAAIAAIFGAGREAEIPGLDPLQTTQHIYTEDQVSDIVAAISE